MKLMVTFKANQTVAVRAKIVTDLGGKIVHQCKAAGAREICVVELGDDKIRTLSGRAGVANVTRDSGMRLQAIEVDTVLANNYQWGALRINAPQVHATGNLGGGKDGEDLRIAVLDTGSEAGHPDLVRAGEFHARSPGTPVTDKNGHGTFTHGIIGAQDNDFGVTGIAPEAAIYPVVVLSDSGVGAWSDVLVATDWCIQNGIKIMSCSFGGTRHPGNELETILQAAADVGIQIVCSAGNGSGRPTGWPAAFDSCIAVASTDEDDTPSSYNSRGKPNEVAGPGRLVKSTYKGGSYRVLSGTSVSAPHVAGVIALGLTAGIADPRAKIPNAVVDLGPAGRDEVTGHGLLMADLMVDLTANPIFGRTVELDTSKSSDPDGTLIDHWFDTGEGSRRGEGSVIEHTYSQDGIYKVRAAVQDNLKKWSPVIEQTIEVKGKPAENIPPTCRLEVRGK